MPSATRRGSRRAAISPTGPACVPQDHLEPVLLRHLRALPAARGRAGHRGGRRRRRTGRRRVHAARRVTGGRRDASTPRYLVARRRRAQRGPARRSASRCTARTASPRRSRPCSARRCGSCSATARYGIYGVDHPERRRASSCPPGPDDRWLYGVLRPEPRAAVRRHGRAARPADPARGAGVPDLAPRIERIGTFTFAAQLAERFRRRERVPRRRRRAPGDAARRHRA